MAIGKTRFGRLQEAGRTASQMASENRVLGAREIAASVDGTTVVTKIGDGVRPWNELPPLGGSGGSVVSGIVGQASAIAATVSTETITGGRRAVFDDWVFTDQQGEVGGVGGASQFGWGYEEEGWYQITFGIEAGFTAGSLALPPRLHIEWVSWFGQTMAHDIALDVPYGFPVAGTQGTLYGGQASITTPVHWAPAASELTEFDELQSMNQFLMSWAGDATLSQISGGAARFSAQLQVCRLG